jgi:hypothetical protein
VFEGLDKVLGAAVGSEAKGETITGTWHLTQGFSKNSAGETALGVPEEALLAPVSLGSYVLL